jgi:hypothetical protein
MQPARRVGLDELGQPNAVVEPGADELEVAPLGKAQEQLLAFAR